MKKFLAVFLTLTFFAGMLPGVSFAAEKSAGGVLRYELTLAGAGETGIAGSNTHLGNITAVNAAVGMGNDASEAGADWSYVGNRSFWTDAGTPSNLAQLTDDGFWWYTKNSSAKAFAGNGMVLKITVDDDGEYIPTVKYLPHHNLTGDLYAIIIDPSLTAVGGKKVDFENKAADSVYYVMNNKAWESLSEVQLAASGAMVSRDGMPSSENMAELSGEALTLKAGEYYLLLAGGSLSSRYAPYINSFELSPVVKVTDIEASVSPVMVGSKIAPDVIWKNGESIIDGSTGTVTVEIAEDKDGILVSDGSGSIYARAEGTATVLVTAWINDSSAKAKADVTVYADGGYAGINSYSYVFTSGAYEDSLTSTGITVPEINEQTFTENFLYRDYGIMRPWGLVAAAASRPNSAGQYFSQSDLYLDVSGKTGDWAAFKIKVPKPGKYTIDASGYTYASGGLAKIYMLPYTEEMDFANIRDNIAEYMSDENYAAKVDFNGSAKAPVMQTNIGSFTAEPSLDYEKGYTDYLMIVESNDSEKKSGTPNVLINTITLVGNGGIANAEVTVDESAIGVGEYTSITGVVAKNPADNVIDLSNAYISHSVCEDDRGILEICDDGKTFKAIGEGSATIETLILIEGSAYVKETEISVSESYGIMNAYLYAPSTGSIGRELVTVIRLEQNNRALLSAGEIVGYEIMSQTADKVVELDDDGRKLIGAGVGTAEVRARVLARGIVHTTDTIVISVGEEGSVEYPSSFKIDFRQEAYSGDTAKKLNELVKYTEYRNWIFHAASNLSGDGTISLPGADSDYSQIVWKNVADESYLAFKVNFPTAGEYEVSSTGYSRYRAAKMELYIMPATEDNIADIQSKLASDNEYYSGAADFYSAEAATGVTKNFGTKKIEAPGEYLVVFRTAHGTAAENSSGDAWYPLYISFVNTSSFARAELSLENGETKMEVGASAKAVPTLFSGDDKKKDYAFEELDEIIFKSSDKTVAAVDESGNITAIGEGKTTITAIITYENVTAEASFELEVEDTSGIDAQKGITVSYDESIYVYGRTKIKLLLAMNSGKEIEIPGEYITWNVTDGKDTADISADGTVSGKAVGKLVVAPAVSAEFKDGADKLTVPQITIDVVWDSAVNPAIYTVKERENAKKNTARYAWAKKEVDAIKKEADKYVENLEFIYDRMVPEGLPRYYHVGHKYDPQKFYCRHCGCNIGLEYGSYAWTVNMLSRPWKVQCPDCKRLFPSNDFESFYKLGITESGVVWSYANALQKHHELFVCEHVKAGQECTHERPIDSAPEPGSAEWMKNDPRNDAWKEFYGYNVPGGYLTNDMYKDTDAELGITGWAVDDGFGYLQPFIEDKNLIGYHPSYFEKNGYAWYKDGTTQGPVQHTYVAYYLHEAIWYGQMETAEVVREAIKKLRDAFVYTGDAKYGRAGAILLDRVADFYPLFVWKQWEAFRGDEYRGKIVDVVWENSLAIEFARAYDAFIPIYNDPYLTEYLSKKSPRYEMNEDGTWKRDENGNIIPVNLKDSPGALRKHVEDNILLEIYDSAVMSELAGNFGMTQTAVITAAVALNRLPETGEMLEWIMKPGTAYGTAANPEPRTGGATMQYLVEKVDRDGNGSENAPGYNRGWCVNLTDAAEMLYGYELYSGVDLFKNVKFMNMFDAQARLTLGGYYGTQTGDSGAVASKGIVINPDGCLTAFRYTRDRDIARALYMYNGNSAEGLRGSILDDDPEQVTEDIERIVEEDGEYALDSDMMTGYGFAALRAGAKHNSANALTETNTNRDFAIYFGGSGGHGHLDGLNLFASAFGLNIAPDIGYPEQTGAQPNRYEWVRTTISHNTVVVNEKEQTKYDGGASHHFDDSGRVKLMDISKDAYEETDDYRRSVIMVEVDDEISYGVDFFHVSGGSDHMYSFHSQSDEISAVSGLSDMTETPMYKDVFGNEYGTYAGTDVKYGADPGGIKNGKYPRGYTWLRNIRTFNKIENDFSVEFKVKDWNKVLPQKRDIRLRLTMVNDDPMEEVTFATAYPPRTETNANIGDLEYLLVRNKGSNLNTTFTTVLEPYEAGNKYIKSIKKLPMERAADAKPGTGDSYGAVRVELENGRIDYIIYSTNNELDYTVDGNINFRGFAGVISFDGEVSADAVIYSYLNDGEVLEFADEEKEESLAAYTGMVKSYTDELEMENSIVFTPTAGQTVDTDALSGKYVYIDNGGVDNAAYRIESAEYDGDDVVLDIGTVSVIRSYVDADDMDRGYVYNIEAGQSLRIPMSSITSREPKVEQPEDCTVSAGSSVTIPINAESMSGKELTLIGTTLPRGMSINQETKTLTWKPDDSQGGENHVAVTVSDGVLETTVHFTVTVYGRTTGSAPSDNAGTSSGGGGGGGGTTDTNPEGSASENTENTGATDETGDGDALTQPDVALGGSYEPQFTDLTSHSWAADAINSLAGEGIIKGTSASTFSPAANITRADFAILLVRAFNLTSDNTENFADVSADDYFAPELCIARNTGIVAGIGDNKYAPRNTITRQDMMVIVYRVLEASLALKGSGAERSVGAVMNDSPVDYQNRDVTEPGEMGPSNDGGGIPASVRPSDDEREPSPVGEGGPLAVDEVLLSERYGDWDTVAPYARDAVSALISAGLVNGKNGLIAPLEYTTRAEIAVLLERVLDYIK